MEEDFKQIVKSFKRKPYFCLTLLEPFKKKALKMSFLTEFFFQDLVSFQHTKTVVVGPEY